MTTLNSNLLKTKQHFTVLDGLRGVAALAIVLFHFMEIAYSDFSKNFIAHGFLAVDFFFCLSGFVIAYAYDDRISKIGVWEFFKSRLIRLHPLIVLGTVLGLGSFIFDPFGAYAALYSAGEITLIFLSSILLIPYPVMEERAFNLFGLNAPTWSLFWEYVANIFYAFVLIRAGRWLLLALTILSAGLLFYVCYGTGNLLGGWSKDNFWDGGARILYSFLAGLTIFRFRLIIKNGLGFQGLTVLLCLAFLMPYNDWNWLTESLVALVYFPLIISLGAGTTVSTRFKKLCEFFGGISYPLYMTHYMVIWMFLNYYTLHKPDAFQVTLIITIATILLIGFAWLVMVFYDIPVRNYLTKRRNRLK